jgi:response regulator RpfG family c-di-GMP phosphodiesterase
MDWQMPEMDGFEATRHIRKMNGKSGQVPIIALSAQSGEDFRQRCHAAGMNDYLSKPYEEIALTSLLAEWLPARETGATAPLNLAKIAGNKPSDSKQMREIGRVFEETTEASLDKLQSAFDSRDPLAGKRESHCLRGSAAAISADDLFKLATALETAFEHSDWKEAEILLDDTQAEYLRLRQYLHLHDQDN